MLLWPAHLDAAARSPSPQPIRRLMVPSSPSEGSCPTPPWADTRLPALCRRTGVWNRYSCSRNPAPSKPTPLSPTCSLRLTESVFLNPPSCISHPGSRLRAPLGEGGPALAKLSRAFVTNQLIIPPPWALHARGVNVLVRFSGKHLLLTNCDLSPSPCEREGLCIHVTLLLFRLVHVINNCAE